MPEALFMVFRLDSEGAKVVNLVGLEKCSKMSLLSLSAASIQPRYRPVKFGADTNIVPYRPITTARQGTPRGAPASAACCTCASPSRRRAPDPLRDPEGLSSLSTFAPEESTSTAPAYRNRKRVSSVCCLYSLSCFWMRAHEAPAKNIAQCIGTA